MVNKYVIDNTVTYRVATVADALALRDELQQNEYGELTNFSYSTKYVKVKGEIAEEYQVVKAKFVFNDVKDPENNVDIHYGVDF